MSSDNDSKRQSTSTQESSSTSTSQSDSKPSIVKPESDDRSTNTVQPLAPPPKPNQDGHQQQSQPSQTPDYFGATQNSSHFSLEPNPFEQSFSNPATGETSGKAGVLPPVASLTSPAPLGSGRTPDWQNSLRAGPLSPAMLQGPVNNQAGYFDQEFRNNYPTPNESSLRTGLTPGGGGSMFPAPSPNTQALFNNLNGGQPTPGTAEFQRAAAAAARKSSEQSNGGTNGVTKAEYQPAQQTSREPFAANQQESEAVNSLYMLAQPNARQGANANQFALANQQQNMNAMQQQQMAAQQQHQQSSPTQQRNNNSIDMSAGDEDDGAEKQSGRAKGKKGSGSKAGQAANGRRKTDETPSKAPPKKRSRGNNGAPNSPDMEDFDDDDDDVDIKDEGDGSGQTINGRKMTDEEKRKNFLERNRVAALKCRQRKKQWLANLQTKVEIFTQENDALSTQCSQLREEIINLKTLLLAHKDCPVSHSQGLGGAAMAQYMGSLESSNGAFGMPAGMQMPNMSGQSIQRS